MTTFSLLAHACGMSHKDVADMLVVRIDTVKSWASGRRKAPATVLVELSRLAVRIDLEAIPGFDSVAVVRSDEEARLVGWPCANAQHMCAGLAIARHFVLEASGADERD